MNKIPFNRSDIQGNELEYLKQAIDNGHISILVVDFPARASPLRTCIMFRICRSHHPRANHSTDVPQLQSIQPETVRSPQDNNQPWSC